MTQEVRKPVTVMRVHDEPRFDPWFVFALVTLVALGIVMVASASIALGARNHGTEFYYAKRHLFSLSMGSLFGYVVYRAGLDTIRRYSVYGLGISILLLMAVLVPGIGHRVNGAWRWLSIGGVTIQASEVAKLGIIVYLAGYLVRHQLQVQQHLWGFAKPIGVFGVIALLLLAEPDMGTTIVLAATTLGMVLLAGAPIPTFIGAGSILATLVGVLIVMEPYRLARLSSYRNPFEHAETSGYQLVQSLIAFGRGEWTGVGLGNSVQKLFYLPEVHTDFIFAVIGEELGLAGTVSVILLFLFLVWRIFRIGERAERMGQTYGANLAYGVALLVGLESFINIGVNMGFFPTKGLTLPFISYGNNSTMVLCAAMALVLRVAHESRTDRSAVTPPAEPPSVIDGPPSELAHG